MKKINFNRGLSKMHTIQWQICNDTSDGYNEELPTIKNKKETMQSEEGTQGEIVQLAEWKDPTKDEYRQAYIALFQQFNSLLPLPSPEEVTKDLLTDDCEAFFLDSSARMPVQYSNGPKEFLELYISLGIQTRCVLQTNVDVDKSTVCQLARYQMLDQEHNKVIDEAALEIYTIKESRISKYRVTFGHLKQELDDIPDPLEPTRIDKMLAKVKRINYTLAGEPNLEELAGLLHEKTQYKIWRWGDSKCFTFSKAEFVTDFRSLEEQMNIVSIIPYEMVSDPGAEFISATYENYLVEESSGSGKKFVWLSNSIYEFDKDITLTKVIQQGEPHAEGQMEIPFEVIDKKKT